MTRERVVQQGVDGIAFDIGLGEGPPRGPDGRSGPRQSQLRPPERRLLPRWAIVAIALLAGWILGALMNTQPTQPEVVAEPEVAVQEAPIIKGPVEAVYEQLGGVVDQTTSAADVLTVVMVQAPLRGVAIPAEVTVIEDGVATRIEVDGEIAGATQGVIGQGDRRMLVVEESVVFMAVDSVMVFDPFQKTEPVEIAKAIYLLPGSEPGHAWAVTSGSRTVYELDVRRQSRVEYDLTAVGSPLASYNGGLVVAPVDSDLGKFALWSPGRGLEKLWMHEEVKFIGAAGNVLVLHSPEGLAAYNTVTGSFDQTSYMIPSAAQHRSIVSPDGSRLAIAAQGSVTELPVVFVVDTGTGKEIDHFEAAFAWQLQWINHDELLFMLPNGDSVEVLVRDTTTGSSGLVTDLVGPNYWVTVAG